MFHPTIWCDSDDYRADVEVVDPKKCLEESCKPKCVKPLLEYQVNIRIQLSSHLS